MANTFTGINDTIISQSALDGFKAGLVAASAFSTDYSPAPGQTGDTVKVMLVGAAGSSLTKTAETAYSISASTAAAVSVSLGEPVYQSWGISDVQRASSSVLNMERFGYAKGMQLARDIFQDILSVVTAANCGVAPSIGVAANFDKAEVLKLLNACDNADMPDMLRSVILKPAWYNQLFADNSVVDASAFGSTDPIRRARIPDFLGFNWYKTSAVPDNSENLVGFACHPSGIAVATRYLAPDDGHTYREARALTDPETGLTLGIRTWYDNASGMTKRVLECVYGYSITGITGSIQRITSA